MSQKKSEAKQLKKIVRYYVNNVIELNLENRHYL